MCIVWFSMSRYQAAIDYWTRPTRARLQLLSSRYEENVCCKNFEKKKRSTKHISFRLLSIQMRQIAIAQFSHDLHARQEFDLE